jgi:hypothetical protein
MNAIKNSPAATTRTRSRSGKFLARASATLAAAGAAAFAAFAAFAAAGPASAATTPTGWEMTAGNVHRLSQQDSATASHFFNTPSSYGIGASLVKTPVQAGYATSPVLGYTSYTQFASNIAGGSIRYPYHWVMYDPEKWLATPVNEQQNPVKYMRLFGQLAHAHGLKVIMAPALDLGAVSGSLLPRLHRESINAWYNRVNIAGAAASAGELYILQDESNTTNLSQYDSLYNSSRSEARAAKPGIKVYSEVSTANGTASQMATAAKSVSADGYYVAAPGAIPQADHFFQDMHTAGY